MAAENTQEDVQFDEKLVEKVQNFLASSTNQARTTKINLQIFFRFKSPSSSFSQNVNTSNHT